MDGAFPRLERWSGSRLVRPDCHCGHLTAAGGLDLHTSKVSRSFSFSNVHLR